jgi:hypothetical protein
LPALLRLGIKSVPTSISLLRASASWSMAVCRWTPHADQFPRLHSALGDLHCQATRDNSSSLVVLRREAGK